ncbi:MAG: hypothetical protein JHC98_06100 [Thermoleophilaceae bacterium]|nr:hypothetical protein [Thermoleophilaceae bacterium]
MGRLSTQLLGATLIVFAAVVIVAALPGGDDFVDSSTLYRTVASLAFTTTGAGALVTSAIAITRDGERSVFTWLALLLGMLAMAFVLGDAISS